jgi:glutamate N-acetyltransferase/amino-acid N-acetyltransferase
MCQGFKFSGVASGLKKNGQKDLGLIYSQTPAKVAGVFTRNQIKAAPVLLDMQRITSGICQAVIVNSGNANCCTGSKGMQDAISMARWTAAKLDIPEEQVLVASTGVIGEPLAVEKVQTAISDLINALDGDGVSLLAEAIMTTDTVPKVVTQKGQLGGTVFTVTGVAKGSGMIRPDMATMLCFVMTDIEAEPALLKEMLLAAIDRTLNRITVDGDTSTNDTALLMANGQSGAVINNDADRKEFQGILDAVLMSLGKQLVKDGDGRAGVPIQPDAIDVYFADVMMVKSGMGCGKKAEAQATDILKQPEYTITIDLKAGNGTASVITCDFSIDYVKINADYRS